MSIIDIRIKLSHLALMTTTNGFDPQEIERELKEFVQSRFGDSVKIETQSKNSSFHEEKKETNIAEENLLHFSFTPKEIKHYLDQYIIEQEEAKIALSLALAEHYNFIRFFEGLKTKEKKETVLSNKEQNLVKAFQKQNILLLGPTGVGKTYLIKMCAEFIGVPFVKADATRFTEAGYVGANVEDIIKDLVTAANQDIELAQYGIVYLDEVDKIAGNYNPTLGPSSGNGRDIHGMGVQHGLLKLMEETEIDIMRPNDMVSQLQAFMEFQKEKQIPRKIVNTKHILFILSGAFIGLEEIINKRLKIKTIGLRTKQQEEQELKNSFPILQQIQTQDLIHFGLGPEFVGRIPIRVGLQQLTAKDLLRILTQTKANILQQHIQSFANFNIELTFTQKALEAIASYATKEQTGARGLNTILEKLLRPYKYELFGSEKDFKLALSEKMVLNGLSGLEEKQGTKIKKGTLH